MAMQALTTQTTTSTTTTTIPTTKIQRAQLLNTPVEENGLLIPAKPRLKNSCATSRRERKFEAEQNDQKEDELQGRT